MTGSTTGIIDEPEALQLSIFHGRDEEGRSAFVVRVALANSIDSFDFAIKRTEVLADASSAFASATAWAHQLADYRVRDLLAVIDMELDIAGASDDDLIAHITDIKEAARRLR